MVTLNTWTPSTRTTIIMVAALTAVGWGKFWLGFPGAYMADTVQRIAILYVLYAYWGRKIDWSLPETPYKSLAWFITITCLTYIFFSPFEIIEAIVRHFSTWSWNIRGWPGYESETYRIFDLTVGLMLAAIAEELIFRKLPLEFWKKKGWSRFSLYFVSAGIFAIIHWPTGVGHIASTFLYGLIFMWAYRASGTLWSPIAIHYLLNLIVFSGYSCDVMVLCHEIPSGMSTEEYFQSLE